MPESFYRLYMHVVFSTRQRQPIIDTEIESELYRYIVGICKTLGGEVINIGGHLDHIHILCLPPKNLGIVNFLEKIKNSSAAWLKIQGDSYRGFRWHDGYSVFSLGESEIGKTVRHINNQHKHHKRVTFKDEYSNILRECGVRYVKRLGW